VQAFEAFAATLVVFAVAAAGATARASAAMSRSFRIR
jgi:hypothetical protein